MIYLTFFSKRAKEQTKESAGLWCMYTKDLKKEDETDFSMNIQRKKIN